MDIRTFRATSLQAALDLVRRELGPDASVLQTREVGDGLLGWLGRKRVEVQASNDVLVARRIPDALPQARPTNGNETHVTHTTTLSSNPPASPPKQRSNDAKPKDDPQILNSAVPGPAPSAKLVGNPRASTPSSPGQTDALPDASNRARKFPANDLGLGAVALEVLTELLDAAVEPELAKELLQQAMRQIGVAEQPDPWIVKGRLCQIVQQYIRVSGPLEVNSGEKQVVALVGPTGVGKTTTLAKLATGFHFDQGCRIGFISTDTFRLGAIDQLRQYAETISAPLEIVRSPDQMQRALGRLEDCHVIMIDTSGRAPSESSHLDTLHDLMIAAGPTSIHLVLSATSSSMHAQAALQAFDSIRPTHLVLTKLDEVSNLGGWLRTMMDCPLPISYVTTGQHVPQDLSVANRRRLSGMVLGNSARD